MKAAGKIDYARDKRSQAIVTTLVSEAREIARRQFGHDFEGFDFDAARWVLSRKNVSEVKRQYALFFVAEGPRVRPSRDRIPKPQPQVFSDVIKAWLIHTDQRPANMVSYAQSAKFLWHAIAGRCTGAQFRWDSLTDEDFVAAEKYVKKRSPKSLRHFATGWSGLLKWLLANEIVSDSLEWKFSGTGKPIERKKSRFPNREILEALGLIYQSGTGSSFHRLLICALGIALVAGFRMSELLTLPTDCWVIETVKGVERYGLRFWLRKSPRGEYKYAIRWLSPLGAELARLCLDEILVVTSRARAQAQKLERTPDQVPVPEIGNKEWLTPDEAAAVFGIVRGSMAPLIRNGHMRLKPREIGYRKWMYSAKEIRAELLRRRPPLYTMQISGKHFQQLSETLLISFVDEGDPWAGTSPHLVRSLPASCIEAFLGAHPKTMSAFERHGTNDAFGNPLRMHLHQMRHWLNTVAYKAGMSAFQITLWMQRMTISQSRLYLHDPAEVADLSQNMVRAGRAIGALASEVAKLTDAEAESRLRLVKEAQVVDSCVCLERISVSKCLRGKMCEICDKALWIIGSETDSNTLDRRTRGFELGLESIAAIEAEVQVVGRLRDNYRACIKKIKHIRKAVLATSNA
jgi:hypothetical protein